MFRPIHPFVKPVGVALVAVVLVWLAVGGALAQDPPDKEDSKVSPVLRELLASVQEPRAAAQVAADADGGVTRQALVDSAESKSAPPPEEPLEEPLDELIRVDAAGNVQVYLYMDSTSEDALAELRELGARIEIVNARWGVIQAWIPTTALDDFAALDVVDEVTLPDYAVTRAGSATTEGDAIHRANLVRAWSDLNGAGVKVGVISDGVDSMSDSQSSGDLPANVDIDPNLPGAGEEGTALLEIVHDLAPGASLAFSGPFGSLEMAKAIDWLANDAFGGAGVDIIVDDLGFYREPFFEDGPVALAAADAIAGGAVFVSAGGNAARIHYEAEFVDGGDGFHAFAPNDTAMAIAPEVGRLWTGLVGGVVAAILQWNDRWGAAGTDYDLFVCLEGSKPTKFNLQNGRCGGSTRLQGGDDRPYELVIFTLPVGTSTDLYIHRYTAGPATRLELFVTVGSIKEHGVPAGGIFGHPAVVGVIATGAIDAGDLGHDELRPSSDYGASEIYFPTRETREKPDLIGINGVAVTGAGGFRTPFYGTSAAAPHVAGVAALVLEATRRDAPTLSKKAAADAVFATLSETAVDLGLEGFDDRFGFGRADALAAVAATGQLSAATFTVDSTGDGADSDTTDGNCDDGNGACTLRAAIQQANAGVGGIIEFGIAGAGPHTIQPASALPTISKTVWLDGLSQPGAGVSSILIELDGTNAGTTTNGLIVAARGSWIRGLAINRFGAAGIVVQTGGAQVIEHNRIGTNPSGATDQGNGGVGVSIVGGTRVQIRSNVISGNGSHGVSVSASGAAGALVTDNVIGTDATGTVDLGNDGVGVYISYAFASEVTRNVISGNGSHGVSLADARLTSILGNSIGTGRDGVSALGNTGSGVHIGIIGLGVTANVVGENTIAFNGGDGVTIDASDAGGNAVWENAIHSNTGLGIDLGPDGVTANDARDADAGANGLQNFPVLTTAGRSGDNIEIVGRLDSTPSTRFIVDFYSNASCDASGYGEGQAWLGYSVIVTDSAGAATFAVSTLDGAINSAQTPMGNFITATATPNLDLSSSEFSACIEAAALPLLDLSEHTVEVTEGGTATYMVALTAQPADTVTVSPVTADASVATVLPSALTFETGTWSIAQSVTVSAVADGDLWDEASSIRHSVAIGTSTFSGRSVRVEVSDDDVPAFTLTNSDFEDGGRFDHLLDMTEGETATYTVAPTTQPGADLTVKLSSSDDTDVTVSPSSLTFNTTTWQTAQTVTLTALEDDAAAHTRAVITHETTVHETTVDARDYVLVRLAVDVADPDRPELTFAPATASVNEGQTTTLTARLGAEPSGPLQVLLEWPDPGALIVWPTTLDFTVDNWSTGQTLTLIGAVDADDRDETVVLVGLTLLGFSLGRIGDVSVSVTDRDLPALQLSLPHVEVEEGATATYTVKLREQPSTALSVSVTSTDASEASVQPATLSFATDTWDQPQIVTVTAVPDSDTLTEQVQIRHGATIGGQSYVLAALTTTVNETLLAPSFTDGDSTVRSVAENSPGGTRVGASVAATDPERDRLTYTFGGADAAFFEIDASSGRLQTKDWLNYEIRAAYDLTVWATDPSGFFDMIDVTIDVINVDEAGSVSFAEAGRAIRATLHDRDGGVIGKTWQWARSSNRNSGWADISGASSARYTPSNADDGMYLQARVSYDDGHGSGKRAQGVSSHEIPTPDIRVATLVSGLSIPWDLAFTPDGTMLFTQRAGVLSSRLPDGTVQTVTADLSDLYAAGEVGFMAIVVDPNFRSNRRFYTCQGHTGPEVQVIAWTIDASYTVATRVADPLVGGLPTASTHGGCRLRFGPRGNLWIATGDGRTGTVPQDLTSLGGKVLRVDATTGEPARGNPIASSLVYTYGHRNVQGLARRPGTDQMWSVEHGPAEDDEINLLAAGRNYGWDPVPGYNQSVAMTDLVKFPGAAEARWSSGSVTLATSGGIFLVGAQWGVWEGRLAVATLKDSKLRIFEFGPDGALVSQVIVPELDGQYGRLRTPMMGPDGALYVTTSNGVGTDQILRIGENRAPAFPAGPRPERSVAENTGPGENIGEPVEASDADGDELSYTLGGDDAAAFEIDEVSGQLRTSDALDYERRSSYRVTVTAADTSGETAVTDVTILVINEDEEGVLALSSRQPQVGTSLTATLTDPDGSLADLSWVWARSADRSTWTTISGATSASYTPDVADLGNFLRATVSYSDGHGPNLVDENAEAVSLNAVAPTSNNAPAFPASETRRRSVVENTPAGVPIGAAVAAIDADNEPLRYTLSGSDSGSFEIVESSGQLLTDAALDYDTKSSYSVTVTVSDPLGASASIGVTIMVINVNETPVVTGDTAPKFAERATGIVARYRAIDPERRSVVWSLGGPDRTDLMINNIGNNIGALRFRSPPDFEEGIDADGDSVYVVTVQASDDFDTGTLDVIIEVTDVNEVPEFPSETTTREIREDATPGATVGASVAATDPERDRLTYTLGGADAAFFEIDASSGRLQTKDWLNYEIRAAYDLTVWATDPSGFFDMIDVTIDVVNVDEAGSVSFAEAGGAIEATLDDRDGGVIGETWQWARSSNRNGGWAGISGATSARYMPSNADAGMYLQARVSYDDSHGSGKRVQGVSSHEIPTPDIRVATLVSGLSIPWDLAFTPDRTMLFTQRAGVLSSRLADGTVQTVTADLSDLYSASEVGFMAIVVDPNFRSNRRFYTCQGHTGPEVQVIAWTIDASYTVATRVADPLVGGLPTASTHGGCRLRFGPQGNLWIATGDGRTGTAPQDLTSLGGKVLRVNATTGEPAGGNPIASSRVYTYGHRNVQGLARRPGTNQMWSVEHGPAEDDEINLLAAGRNYGWDPVPGYNQSVAMTDLVKFPGAVEPRWSSGSVTLATSGGIFLVGAQWGVWEGRLAVATLKDSKLRIFEFGPDGALVSQVIVPELDGRYGRLRTPMMGPDGALYVTTSNGGGNDRILRIAENRAPAFPTGPRPERSVAENTGPGGNIGEPVEASDADGDQLSYMLGGADAAWFEIDEVSGELRTSGALNYEGRSSYRVTVTAADTSGKSAVTDVTILVINEDEDGEIMLSSRQPQVGTSLTATLADPDGRLRSIGWLWERRVSGGSVWSPIAGAVSSSYRPSDGDVGSDLRVTASYTDGQGSGKSVQVLVPNAVLAAPPMNRAPAFPDTESGERSVDENTPAGRNIGAPVSALDPDNDLLTYRWSGGGAAVFELIESSNGVQLRTKEPLNHEGRDSYSFSVTARDPSGAFDTLTVIVTVLDVNEPPEFRPGSETREVPSGDASDRPVGSPVAAADPDAGDVLSYDLSGAGVGSFTIDTASGQLRTTAPLALGETYDVTVTAMDQSGGRASVDVMISVAAPPVRRVVVVGGGGGGGGGPPPVPIPSEVDFEWNVTRDIESLDANNDLPTGLWSDGETLWVVENSAGGADALFAYALESGERRPEHEFALDPRNRFSHGVWSDRETLWVADSGQDRLFAYDLAGGERLVDRDLELAERNRDPRGIWSDRVIWYVLDSVKRSLFTYDVESGELLAEYELVSLNNSPRGIWSDHVTIWVSDDGAKRLFAYRVEGEALTRIEAEEFSFRSLLKAGNGAPRGIWSDGEVVFVVDEQDDHVYTYNLPDAADARLASLALSDVEFGEFDGLQTEYVGLAAMGVTETTIEAQAAQPGATVVIEPADANSEADNGHQIDVTSGAAVTITVTSEDGSRTRVYRVEIAPPPPSVTNIELRPDEPTVPIEWPGLDDIAIADALRGVGDPAANDISEKVSHVFTWDAETEAWLIYVTNPRAQSVPGLHTLATLQTGREYWVNVTEPVTWIVAIGGS